MKIFAALVLSMLTAYAQDRPQRNWNISVAFFVGAQVMDTMSSRGSVEANPVLGRGQFGARQMAIKAGIGGGVVLAERMIVRKRPEIRRFFTWANYGSGAAVAGVAIRNWKQSPYTPLQTASPIAK
jgi:hypothetical protein